MPNAMWYGNLPDGMHDVIVSKRGGLYLSGFDSLRRVCLILFAPPYGQPLRTITELPYRDYGRYTPTVLTAHDPKREDHLYILLYLHPDNLGTQEMVLFRLDVSSGARVQLSSMTSPFWVPTAMLPRADGSVLVSLSGLGPLLSFDNCNASACDAAKPSTSAASNAIGKAGLADVYEPSGERTLCLMADEMALRSDQNSAPRLVCEDADGALREVLTSSEVEERNITNPHVTDGQAVLAGPSSLVAAADGALYIITRDASNEYGYTQGSVHVLRRRPFNASEPCPAASAECWAAAERVVTSVSNPRSVALDELNGLLYVLEENSLVGFNYEPFHGDVLAFCAAGRYDCMHAQNSGECDCAFGWGGACCDIPRADLFGSGVSWLVAYGPVVLAAVVVALLLAAPFRSARPQGSGAASREESSTDLPSLPALRTPLVKPEADGRMVISGGRRQRPAAPRAADAFKPPSLRSVLMGTDALPSPNIRLHAAGEGASFLWNAELEFEGSASDNRPDTPGSLSDLCDFSATADEEPSTETPLASASTRSGVGRTSFSMSARGSTSSAPQRPRDSRGQR
ncbi:hypothetical protein AB1Y20_008080 [Prymnesium parvum]|uniref:EGF-like domain-containing protein n=1 Tax=Prymnesium parvum TaxID=97485 RepID=A0AB34IVL2_PRYPA